MLFQRPPGSLSSHRASTSAPSQPRTFVPASCQPLAHHWVPTSGSSTAQQPSGRRLQAPTRALSLRVGFRQQSDEASVLESVVKTNIITGSFDDEQLYDTNAECPHGAVIGIMRAMEKEPGVCSWPQQVLTAYPDESLESIIPRLNKVTGLPVIDRVHGKVVGVISRKDIIKHRNARGSMAQAVSLHMTAPAIVVPASASVQQAADLMLKKRIRRLPVVDEDGYAVGIVSRSDIFKPLFREAYNLYMEKEKAALLTGDASFSSPSTSSPIPSSAAIASALAKRNGTAPAAALAIPQWRIKYLYDGDCPMCLSLMTVLRRQDNSRGLINFINIADPQYQPRNHMGITYEEAMETIHAIYPDGSVVQGTVALKELFSTVGLGWAVYVSEMPFVNKLVDILYQFLSANRLSLGGALDGIIAAKRMDLSKQGVETCGDMEEECTAEW